MNQAQFCYRIPTGVRPDTTSGRLFLTTQEGGRVWIDRTVLEIWKAADGRTLDEVLSIFREKPYHPLQILAGLICLAEAGLLTRNTLVVRDDSPPLQRGDLVSVVIVAYNSRVWLPTCLDSLAGQSYSPVEIIIVDNASQDGSADWIAANHPEVRLIRLEQTEPLARALNRGMNAANGMYYLLLNPDVRVERDAVAQLVKVVRDKPLCAAAAARLRLMWTPSFLNGLGNFVGAISWGSDIGLGHLDLGQFDCWSEIPSACFAAALIPRRIIEEIGCLDEGFPMYYEDCEWCYRARLLGYKIQAAPKAIVDHAFSARQPAEISASLSPIKLRRVSYGRLRFITRINASGYFWSFLINYLLEDSIRSFIHLIKGRLSLARASWLGWGDFFHVLPELRKQRKEIQSKRRLSDPELFSLQRGLPVPRIFAGTPQLTWEAICDEYLPLILSKRTKDLPEFLDDLSRLPPLTKIYFPQTVIRIWQNEGIIGLARWIGRRIQWELMQP